MRRERFPHDCAYGHYHKQCVALIKYFCFSLLSFRFSVTVEDVYSFVKNGVLS